MAVFVADEQGGRADAVPVDVERVRRLAEHVLADQRVPATMEVAVLCVDRDAIAELNVHHMGHAGPTDVLAFPIDLPGEAGPDEPSILGDVVVCPAVAAAQAADHDKTTEAEIDLLVVHGILHLLGHDHAEPEEQRVMFALTDRLLGDFAARQP